MIRSTSRPPVWPVNRNGEKACASGLSWRRSWLLPLLPLPQRWRGLTTSEGPTITDTPIATRRPPAPLPQRQAAPHLETKQKPGQMKLVKAAALMSWIFLPLLTGVGSAGTLQMLEQPRMLGAGVGAAPESVWPLDERLSLPYTPSDDAPACAPVISRQSTSEKPRVSAPEEVEEASRTLKHRRYGRWRRGDELAGGFSYSGIAGRTARGSHGRHDSHSIKPAERRPTLRGASGKASARRVRAEFYPHGPLTR